MAKQKNKGYLLKELKANGFLYADLNEIFRQKSLSPIEVEIIIKWLPSIYVEHLGAGDILVRSLISASEPFKPDVLIDLFENSSLNGSIKWGIGHVLAVSRTTDISDWLRRQLLNDKVLFERAGLVTALKKKGGFQSTDEYKAFLQSIFWKYPTDVIDVYKKCLSKSDLDFFLEQLNRVDGSTKRQLEKILVKISKLKD